MKIRLGFVSNSSSSSYVCDVCGLADGGYDVNIKDVGMVECSAGHTFCENHIELQNNKNEIIRLYLETHSRDYRTYDEDSIMHDMYYEFPVEYCPICSLQHIGQHEINQYMKLRFGLTKEEILDDIKNTFGTYEAFLRACRET